MNMSYRFNSIPGAFNTGLEVAIERAVAGDRVVAASGEESDWILQRVQRRRAFAIAIEAPCWRWTASRADPAARPHDNRNRSV